MLTIKQYLYIGIGCLLVFSHVCVWRATDIAVNRKWQLKEAQAQIIQNNKLQKLQADNNALNLKVSNNLNAVQVKTEIQYKTIYKDRIKYVEKNPNIIVYVPIYWGMYINSAIANTDMSDAISFIRTDVTASTVGIDRLADKCVSITESYYGCKAKYEAWQEWYRNNERLRNK